MVSPDTRLDKGQIREADAGAFYRERDREAVRKEARALMGTQGVYAPEKWVARWDAAVAIYLGHWMRYVGTQADRDGWIWDSQREVEEKTGLGRYPQDRALKRLVADGVLEFDKGGIGNKRRVRVNLPLLALMDEMDGLEGAADLAANQQTAVLDSSEHPAANQQTGMLQTSKHFAASQQTHNSKSCKSPVSLSRGREEKGPEERSPRPVDGKLSRCLDVLSEAGLPEDQRDRTADTLARLVEQYPKLDPVQECRKVLDSSANRPVRKFPEFLAGRFERTNNEVAAEPPNPHGAGSEVFVAPEKDRTQPRVDPRLAIRLIREGVPDYEAWRRATVYPEDEAA